MKTNPVAFRFSRRQSGMALISVLAVLFLLTLLVVAFMARTTGARASAANYRATASTKALADTAINLVQAQINEATTQGLVADASGNLIGTETWGSQPGAIRVFASAVGAQGQLNKVYRLYSATPTDASSARVIDVSSAASDASANTTALAALAADLPVKATWTQFGAQWCDLNAYARDSEGKYHFPILDPRDPGAPDPTLDPTTVATLWQPSSGVPALHGISVQAPGTVGIANNPAPMPVRWLYILKDGSVVQPDQPATPSNQLTFLNATNALGTNAAIVSVKNPIVGRIAFWTDDESSKININTAAGDDVVRAPNIYPSTSIFWDTPSFSTTDEEYLAYFQPLSGEIQRYAGHPGAVGLNTTLSTLAGMTTPMSYADFYSLTPRYTGGGSISGTQAIANQNQAAGAGASSTSLVLTANRLYTSIGEMIYTAAPLTGGNRPQSTLVADSGSEARAASAVERSNFFLTAHSSSSELNLSGTPRVSIWPVVQDTLNTPKAKYQTVMDRLLAFDATIPQTTNGNPDLFYFQRLDSKNAVTDAGIANNKNLFNYLDRLTSRTNAGGTSAIPGFGSDFAGDKYKNSTNPGPPASRQIIAEIFDYIRTVNVLDPIMQTQSSYGKNYTYGQNWGDDRNSVVAGINQNGGNTTVDRGGMGSIQVVPSSNVNGWGCHGIAAFPIPVEVTIDFAALGTGALPKKGLFPATPEKPIPAGQYTGSYKGVQVVQHDQIADTDPLNPSTLSTYNTYDPNFKGYDNITDEPGGGGKPANQSTAMQAFIYVSFVNPGEITSFIMPAFAYSMSGLDYLSVSGYYSSGVYGTVGSGSPPPPPSPGSSAVVKPLKKVYLRFPGNTFNTAYASSIPNQTLYLVNDNPYGYGYIGGDVGNWVFGYISFLGDVGIGNAGALSSMTLGPTQTTWNTTSGYGYNQRTFPFYSQIFGLPGVQNWTSAQGNYSASVISAAAASNTNPISATVTMGTPGPPVTAYSATKTMFQFNGNDIIGTTPTDIVLKMYDCNHDGQDIAGSNVVSTYEFSFPPAALLLPTFSTADSQIIGTGAPYGPVPAALVPGPDGRMVTDRWHQAIAYNTDANEIATTTIAQDDTVQSLVLSPTWSDVRDLALSQVGSNTQTVFGMHPLYGFAVQLVAGTVVVSQAHNLLIDAGHPVCGNLDPANWGRLVTQTVGSGVSYAPSTNNKVTGLGGYNYPVVPPRLNGPTGAGLVGQGAYTTTGAPGDWDNGVAAQSDGPWVNMPDEGALMDYNNNNNGSGTINGGITAYYSTGNNHNKTGTSFAFSPNRQMPSPAMFGSLPTGVNSANPQPWQTLLFRPGAGAGGFGKFHPGEKDQPAAGDPADHLLLDLFWMPQVEPFPISSPFATEGKINLNYEIQPFTYITRDTALRALFSSEEIAVMPDALASSYKQPWYSNTPNACPNSSLISATGGTDVNGNSRLPIDPDATLGLNPSTTADPHAPASGSGQSGSNAWYDSSAGTTRFFKSASEICEMFLVPQGYTWKQFSGASFGAHSWYKIPSGDFALVGDNKREKPYADLYSRVTTKSNTFTVYYTVQALKNAEPQTDSGQQHWDENLGGIVGEYRGSTTLERYLDPNQTLPDYLNATSPAPPLVSLEPYYRWRVVATRQFAP